jgi:hypothetical protein
LHESIVPLIYPSDGKNGLNPPRAFSFAKGEPFRKSAPRARVMKRAHAVRQPAALRLAEMGAA